LRFHLGYNIPQKHPRLRFGEEDALAERRVR